MSSEIAPFKPNAQSMKRDSEQLVRPGEWWAWIGDEDDLPVLHLKPGAPAPEAPLTLLVTDVRIHDGEIHSIHLAAHPSCDVRAYGGPWPMKVLSETFFRNWRLVDQAEAEARRARELQAVMAGIERITQQISRGPAPEVILEITQQLAVAERKGAYKLWRQQQVNAIAERFPGFEQGAERKAAIDALPDEKPADHSSASAIVPAALLPSGDVLAVQTQIEGKVRELKAREQWLGDRSKEMTAAFGVVSDYQLEKVRAVTSSISTHMTAANKLLDNVHTMKLFLGEGAELQRLITGESAPAAEPLHLMQRMLFLDEEIWIADRFLDGFTGDDISSLPELLAANPSIIQRMLPHPRCVAITRMRRGARPFEFEHGGDLALALTQIWEVERQAKMDARVIMLIRDGENISMVVADEDTSRASRLFPSEAEINGIYRGSKGGAEITPHDIEYSDKRNEHDARALFYKRFLLILWGLHEREDAFGPFLPKGENWLLQSVTHDAFRFVHDEEMVLGNGRLPVKEWLIRNNASIRPGSRVLIRTRDAFKAEFAPTAYKRRHGEGDVAIRVPAEQWLVATVKRRGSDLVVDCPSVSADSWRSTGKVQNTPLIVNLRGEAPRGLFCLDTAGSAEVLDYIESRIERSSYLEWLSIFDRALPLLRERESGQRVVIDALEALMPATYEVREALQMQITARRKAGPLSTADAAAAAKIARAWLGALEKCEAGDVVLGYADGSVGVITPMPEEDGFRIAGLLSRDIHTGDITRRPADACLERSAVILRGYEAFPKMVRETRSKAQPAFATPESLDLLRTLNTDDAWAVTRGPRAITEEEAGQICDAFLDAPPIEGGYIGFPHADYLLMTCAAPATTLPMGRYHISEPAITRSIIVRENLFAALIAAGHEEMVVRALRHQIPQKRMPVVLENIRANRFNLTLSERPVAELIARRGKTICRQLISQTSGWSSSAYGAATVLSYYKSNWSAEEVARVNERARVFAGGRETEVMDFVSNALLNGLQAGAV